MYSAQARLPSPPTPHQPGMASVAPQYRDNRVGSMPYHAQHTLPALSQTTQSYSELAPLAPGTQPAPKNPSSRSCVENGRRYRLEVVQQPQRARMCGFGDKDRRPITPPPCVRLIITDAETGKEIDCNDIDHSMFVLTVDLWDGKGTREVNLVRHSPSSPSISATTAVSYGQISETTPAYTNILPGHGPPREMPQPYQGSNYSAYPPGPPPPVNTYAPPSQQYPATPTGSHQYGSDYPPPPGSHAYNSQNGFNQQQQGGNLPMYYNQPQSGYQPADPAATRMPVTNAPPVGMYTRNLIGSLAASAFRLTDPDDRIGIWFVLQDLSVRTEGEFRLQFSFVNVSVPPSPTSGEHGQGPSHLAAQPLIPQISQGRAPVLAACFSESFVVYSAKRFPGVVESTNLSKCFATQGIKIPIRKDGQGKGGKGDEDDD